MLYTVFMSKDLNVSRLCDVYGALLTDHRRELVREYYDNDLSLAEIAENSGITRQAALCSIKQAEKQLKDYEQKLGLAELYRALETELQSLLSVVDTDVE
ncbi:MAG: hypothetical protein K2L54_04030, partial [Clostridiales bacterium]|nr:hypothetical protein [Clostridiales bacterium]